VSHSAAFTNGNMAVPIMILRAILVNFVERIQNCCHYVVVAIQFDVKLKEQKTKSTLDRYIRMIIGIVAIPVVVLER
jgi:hypothetical protein